MTIRSLAQGTTQNTSTSGQGLFSVSSLPAGQYDVTVTAAGDRAFTATAIDIIPGRTTQVPVTLASGAAAEGNEIVVVGRRIEAFTSTTIGLSVDVEQLKQTVPIERNLTSIILLAPGTVRGAAAFGNLASINGSSVAENAYYLNGLNITNFDNYIGSAEVPFDFYKTVEVKAGGYPAEFGRATGGIINAITKSGTNRWSAGLHLNWEPNFLRANGKDRMQCEDSPSGVQCSPITDWHSKDTYENVLTATLEGGGPIIRDRFFVYGLLERHRHHWETLNRISQTAFRFTADDPFWGAKVDVYPVDNHHLELTVFDTRNRVRRADLPYTPDSQGNYSVGIGPAGNETRGGGVNYVGKYTGRFADFLTVSAAYGRMHDRFDYGDLTGKAGKPFVRNRAGYEVSGVPDGGYYTDQRDPYAQDPYSTQRKFYRADIDLAVHLFGDHHVRAGWDREDNRLAEATVTTGGDFLYHNGYITSEAFNANLGGAGLRYVIRNARINRANTPQVEVSYSNSAGTYRSRNEAIYAEDEWRLTDRLTINAGVRRDNFRLNSGSGAPFVTLKNNWQPRIGVTYDLWGDRRGRLKAFYGQYYLPFASNTSNLMTAAQFNFVERYALLGFDGNGVPILGAQVTDNGAFQSACPFLLVPGPFERQLLFGYWDRGHSNNRNGDFAQPQSDQGRGVDLRL